MALLLCSPPAIEAAAAVRAATAQVKAVAVAVAAAAAKVFVGPIGIALPVSIAIAELEPAMNTAVDPVASCRSDALNHLTLTTAGSSVSSRATAPPLQSLPALNVGA